ncbi:MAG: 5'-nucleotidase C-terminal domain-containing protein [Vampirovibrionales bacterium]
MHGTIGGHTHEVYQANLTKDEASNTLQHFTSTLTPNTPAPIMKAGMDLMGVDTITYYMQRNGDSLWETLGNILNGQAGFKPVAVDATHYDLTGITMNDSPHRNLEKAIPANLKDKMKHLLTPLKPVTDDWKATTADLRGGPSAVHNFWNDLLVRHIEQHHKQNLPYPDKPVLVVWQSSGLRSQDEATFPLPSATQPLRLLDPILYNPFPNKAVCLGMTGRELKEALEQGASHLADHLTGSDRTLSHPSGFTYTLDLIKPAEQRISDLALPDGRAIQQDDLLNIVFTEYLATGNGGYELGELYQQRLKEGKVWTSDELVSALYTQQLQQETAESSEPFVLDEKPRFNVIQQKCYTNSQIE